MNAVADRIDRQQADRARLAHDESTVDSHIENAPRGAQIVQIETLGKPGMYFLLFVLGLGLVLSIWALERSGEALAAATQENTVLREEHAAQVAALREDFRRNNGKLEVLQYDHNALKAQLVSKGIYQGTEH